MTASVPAARGPRAVVLCIGGHDPSTAGIQADIETCAALGCVALSVVTACTTQNTAVVSKVRPTSAADVRAQVLLLLAEFQVRACKIGLIPNAAVCRALGRLLRNELHGCPVVVDPVLRAGSGGRLAREDIRPAFMRLLPHTTVLTPNLEEALDLSGAAGADTAAERLLASGCGAVLVTDTLPAPAPITNRLWQHGAPAESFVMERFAGAYHGTGCTLASAIACGLATGSGIRGAVAAAQEYVHRAVACAHQLGTSQAIPDRFAIRRA